MQRLAPICLGLIGLTASNALIASPPVADYIIKQNGASVVPLSTLTRSRPATPPVSTPSSAIPPVVRPVVKEAPVVAKPSVVEPTAPVRPTVAPVAIPASPKKEEPVRSVQVAPVEKPVVTSPPVVLATKPDPAPAVAVSKPEPAPVVVPKKPDPAPVTIAKKSEPVPENVPALAGAAKVPPSTEVAVPQGLSAAEILAGVVAPIKKAIANVMPTPAAEPVPAAKPVEAPLAAETRKTIEAAAAVAAAFEASAAKSVQTTASAAPKPDNAALPLAEKGADAKSTESLVKASSSASAPSAVELVKTATEPTKQPASQVKTAASSGEATAKPYENDLQWQQKEAPKETPPAKEEPVKATVTPPAVLNRIAVLLPTRSAVLGDAAKVVRAGVEAAAKVDGGPEIFVVDSGDTDVPARYREALAAGAKVIIGPLARPQIAAISNLAKVPTLALNTLEGAHANVYSLNLSVEGEAKALARRVYGDGLRRPVIVAGSGSFDKRIAQSFAAEWQALGGKNLRRLAPSALTNIAESDVAILAVESTVAKPLLASLSGRPIYATSQLHERTGTRLAGVTLMDMPWLASSGDKLVARYPRPAHSQTISSDRLYALGIDAWRLATRLAADPTATSLHLDGVTGGLTLSKTREFDRVLSVVR